MSRRKKVALGVAVVAVVAGALAWSGLPQRVALGRFVVAPPEGAPPPAPAPGAFPHALLGRALEAHVGEDGLVDYAGLKGDRDLAAYVGLLAAYSPESHPALFPGRDARLAYHLNAYNALALWGVTRAWPLESVQALPSGGLVTLKPGQGFFYSQRFVLGGREVHLYGLENETIRGYGDARVHAAINCASQSCPRLRREVFEAPTLEAQLSEAAAEFVDSPRHLRVDAAGRRVVASSIFDWFRGDFEVGGERLPEWWLAQSRDPAQRAALEQARREGYAISFAPYDWSVNAK